MSFKPLTITVIALMFTLLLAACNGTNNHNEDDHLAMHIGPIETAQLLNQYPIFEQHKQDNEQPANNEQIAQLAKQLHNKDIVVVFGTWCHDSQREVPRLLNLIEKVKRNHPEANFTTHFHAVAPTEQRDPAIVKQYNITFVPTIMLFEGDREMGRIIERTKQSLAVDLTMMN